MVNPLSFIGSGLLRGLICAVLAQGVGWGVATVYRAIDGDSTAVLGAGLIAFATLLLIAGLWGVLDGRRRPDGVVAHGLTWLVAGAVAGVSMVIWMVVMDGAFADGFDATVLLSDLVSVAPLICGLTAVPGFVGSLLGSTRSRLPATRSSSKARWPD